MSSHSLPLPALPAVSCFSLSVYQRTTVNPKNMSTRVLGGEGPGIAATKAMDWSAEMTGIHRQYQTWGYIDPFPVLRDGAMRFVAVTYYVVPCVRINFFVLRYCLMEVYARVCVLSFLCAFADLLQGAYFTLLYCT